MILRTMASRHSAFYSPLLCAVQFLRRDGHDVSYGVLQPGQRTHALIRDAEVDVMQSAVGSNWGPIEQGISPLPIHFAQINTRDGFFLVGRDAQPDFTWNHLEGATLVADHGHQPLLMLKYAIRHNGIDWNRIKVVDAGTPEQMQEAFSSGVGDYLHQQAPVAHGAVVASVGASMPPVAFSSLCCSRDFRKTDSYAVFRDAYQRAREWVRSAPPSEVADAVAPFFPGVPVAQLADAVTRYQALGTWEGGIAIPKDLYEQALTVFESGGAIARRYPFEDVVSD